MSPAAEAVGYAIDPKLNLSATPSTLIGDGDGVGDRSRGAPAAATRRAPRRSRSPGVPPRQLGGHRAEARTSQLGGGRWSEPALGGDGGLGVVCGDYQREQHAIRLIGGT
jgi:hypothetical protein